MHDFKDKVAVVIGGGSGIGEGFVRRCASENMRIVIGDIDKKNLDRVTKDLISHIGVDNLLALKMDIGKKNDLVSLAEQVKEKFGRIDLLFNQAGIPGPLGPIWEASYANIERTVEINLLGMMYSLRTFLPIMIKQNTPGHVINTSSGAGFQLSCNMACYMTTKRAVIALSEALSLDLYARKSKIHVSVLCPGMVKTNFANNIPKVKDSDSEPVKNLKNFFKESLHSEGISIEKVVSESFDAIKNNRFYILTHFAEHYEKIKSVTDNMLSGNNPVDLFRK